MLALALLLLVANPEPVSAKLASAQAAAAALDLDIARDLLLDVVTDPAATPEQQRRAHLLAGEVDRILGKDVDARMHFMWVLQRDPDTQLPPDKPPKISAFFELVRAEVKDRDALGTTASPRSATTPVASTPAETPAETPQEQPASSANTLPLVVTGIGAVGAVSGLALAFVGESQFAQTDAQWTDREGGQYAALAGWTLTGAAAVVVGAGLVWWSAAP